jgi:hypothetical protein
MQATIGKMEAAARDLTPACSLGGCQRDQVEPEVCPWRRWRDAWDKRRARRLGRSRTPAGPGKAEAHVSPRI